MKHLIILILSFTTLQSCHFKADRINAIKLYEVIVQLNESDNGAIQDYFDAAAAVQKQLNIDKYGFLDLAETNEKHTKALIAYQQINSQLKFINEFDKSINLVNNFIIYMNQVGKVLVFSMDWLYRLGTDIENYDINYERDNIGQELLKLDNSGNAFIKCQKKYRKKYKI